MSKGRHQLKSSQGKLLKKLYNGALLKELLSSQSPSPLSPQVPSPLQTPYSPISQASSTSEDCILENVAVKMTLKIQLATQPQEPKKQRKNCPRLSDKNIAIVEEGKMLNDEHIHFAAELLCEQFPNGRGLQRTIFGQNLSFQKANPLLCRYWRLWMEVRSGSMTAPTTSRICQYKFRPHPC